MIHFILTHSSYINHRKPFVMLIYISVHQWLPTYALASSKEVLSEMQGEHWEGE